jgi:hypothetical protein
MDPLLRTWLTNSFLFEDVNTDVEAFKKRYKEVHGIDPTPEQLVDVAGKFKSGQIKSPEELFPQASKTPAPAPKPEYTPTSGTSDPEGMKKAMEGYRELAKRHGVDLPPGLEKTLELIRYSRGVKSADQTAMDMILNQMGEQGKSASTTPEAPKTPEATTPAPTAPAQPPMRVGEPVTPPTTRTPEESSMAGAKDIMGKAGRGIARGGVTPLFAGAGALNLPSDISQIAKSAKEKTYGRSRVIMDPMYKGTETEEEMKSRGMQLAAQDVARAGEDVTMAGSAASLIPGGSRAAKVARTAGRISGAAFSPLAAVSTGLETKRNIEAGETGKAIRSGADTSQWAAQFANTFVRSNPLATYATLGLGKQFSREGMKSWLRGDDSSALEKGLATAGGALGAGMMAQPLAAGAKAGLEAAGEKALTRAGAKAMAKGAVKGALKATPIGALVAAPYAISRAMEGDWTGAGLEALGAIPGVGFVTEPILAYRDVQKEQEERKKKQKEYNERWQSRYDEYQKRNPQTSPQEFMRDPAAREEQLRATRPYVRESVNLFENIMRTGLQTRGI